MVTVACVYKPGKGFSTEYVYRLRDGLLKQSVPFKFLCLTTDRDLVRILADDARHIPSILPGWWNKLFLFSPIMPLGRIVYFDLDTVVSGNIENLLSYTGKKPLFLDDFYYPGNLATGIMAWEGEQLSFLYDKFMKNKGAIIGECDRGARSNVGDQAYLRKEIRKEDWLPVQGVQEGVLSYKKDMRTKQNKTANIVCFHGHPRPHEVGWRV